MDVKDYPVWIRLSFVSCVSNGPVLMDKSLQLLPAVETLAEVPESTSKGEH